MTKKRKAPKRSRLTAIESTRRNQRLVAAEFVLQNAVKRLAQIELLSAGGGRIAYPFTKLSEIHKLAKGTHAKK